METRQGKFGYQVSQTLWSPEAWGQSQGVGSVRRRAAMRCGVCELRGAAACGPLPTIPRRHKPFLTPPPPPPPRRLTAARNTAPRCSTWGAGPPRPRRDRGVKGPHFAVCVCAAARRLAEFPPPGNASPCAPPARRPGPRSTAWCMQGHLAKQGGSTGGQVSCSRLWLLRRLLQLWQLPVKQGAASGVRRIAAATAHHIGGSDGAPLTACQPATEC